MAAININNVQTVILATNVVIKTHAVKAGAISDNHGHIAVRTFNHT